MEGSGNAGSLSEDMLQLGMENNCNQRGSFKLEKCNKKNTTHMFQIYVNDMQCVVTSYMNLFADNANLMRVV